MVNYTIEKSVIFIQITPNSSLKTEGSDLYTYFRSRHIDNCHVTIIRHEHHIIWIRK
jgi:hypothetical protein